MSIFAKIKALWAVKKELNKMSMSELKTSEGRLALLMNVLGIYAAVKGLLPMDLAAKIAAGSVLVYTLARAAVKFAEAIAKVTPSKKDDAIVEEVGKALDAIAPKS